MKVIWPPYETVANEFREAFNHHVSRIALARGILSSVSRSVIHEGGESGIVRADAHDETVSLTETRKFQTEIAMPFTDIEKITPEMVFKKIQEVAELMGQQQSQMMIDAMKQATEETGNIVDARGQPLNPDFLYEMMDKKMASYDEITGETHDVILAHPALAEKLAAIGKQIDDDPILQKRFNDLDQRKRDEFRTREMDRNLAG